MRDLWVTVVDIRRGRVSKYANPSFVVTTSDGREFRSGTDCAVGWDTENIMQALERHDGTLDMVLTIERNRVTYATYSDGTN